MSDLLREIPPWVYHIVFSVARWLHVVATAVLVGGTLFFEFVVPRAIDEMKMEDQLSVIGRLRWAWRQLIWACAVILPITGLIIMYHVWPHYARADGRWTTAFPWALVHMIGGCIIVAIAVAIVAGPKVPERARSWLKVNFVVMLAVIFMASASRHVRMFARDQHLIRGNQQRVLPPSQQR